MCEVPPGLVSQAEYGASDVGACMCVYGGHPRSNDPIAGTGACQCKGLSGVESGGFTSTRVYISPEEEHVAGGENFPYRARVCVC